MSETSVLRRAADPGGRHAAVIKNKKHCGKKSSILNAAVIVNYSVIIQL